LPGFLTFIIGDYYDGYGRVKGKRGTRIAKSGLMFEWFKAYGGKRCKFVGSYGNCFLSDIEEALLEGFLYI
jgi:hypothetical protein